MSKTRNNREAVRAEACRFLAGSIVASVATTYKSMPYNSMLYYATDEHCNFYVETIESTGNYLSLIMNPNCALIVVDPKSEISVQMRGWAIALKGNEKKQARKLLIRKRRAFDVGKWPLHELREIHGSDDTILKKAIFKIVPHDFVFFNPGDRSYPFSLSRTMHALIS